MFQQLSVALQRANAVSFQSMLTTSCSVAFKQKLNKLISKYLGNEAPRQQ